MARFIAGEGREKGSLLALAFAIENKLSMIRVVNLGAGASLMGAAKFPLVASQHSIIAAGSWRARSLLAGTTIATAVPASSATASATTSTTAVSSATFAAAIVVVLEYFVEAEQHGCVLLLLLHLVDVKLWVRCRCQVCFSRCRSELGLFGHKTRGKSSACCVSLRERPPNSR